jgi:hypothetical protein
VRGKAGNRCGADISETIVQKVNVSAFFRQKVSYAFLVSFETPAGAAKEEAFGPKDCSNKGPEFVPITTLRIP